MMYNNKMSADYGGTFRCKRDMKNTLTKNDLHWMRYSIDIASQPLCSSLRVGATLISKSNELICAVCAQRGLSWITSLLNEVQRLNVSQVRSIFVTINTWTVKGAFDLQVLLEHVHVDNIYVGLPDPKLTSYLDYDPVIKCKHIYRYPDNLQRKIMEQNKFFFLKSNQNIKYNPYYDKHRISKLVIDGLNSYGVHLEQNDLNSNRNDLSLASLLCHKYGIEYSKALQLVHNVISEAFNTKYGEYNYTNDARFLSLDWKHTFFSIYKELSSRSISESNVINVGVANGYEALHLFSSCKHIIFVDIATCGLDRIQKQMPEAKCVIASAGALSAVPSQSQDLYVSLRTYNSSFFNIQAAVTEAYRVLKSRGAVIVSVANGFLCPEAGSIIPGLIVPSTKFVDIYRGLDTARQIQNEFIQAGFVEVRILSTPTEIYISALKDNFDISVEDLT